MMIECNYCHELMPHDTEIVHIAVTKTVDVLEKTRMGGRSYHLECYEEHVKPALITADARV